MLQKIVARKFSKRHGDYGRSARGNEWLTLACGHEVMRPASAAPATAARCRECDEAARAARRVVRYVYED